VLIVEDRTVTVKYRKTIKALFLYLNVWLSVTLNRLSIYIHTTNRKKEQAFVELFFCLVRSECKYTLYLYEVDVEIQTLCMMD
jgi:hypothetical protein